MMRFLRTLFGCSRREAAHDEEWRREAEARAEVMAEINARVRQVQRAARSAEAAARLMRGLGRDVTRW